MIGEILVSGDQVRITIPKENREWGYNPCPDGTVSTVLGPSEITYGRINNFGCEPGVYPDYCWMRLRMPDGTEHLEFDDRLTLLSQEEQQLRIAEWRKSQSEDWRKKPKLRDLPHTAFWEHDVVYSLRDREQQIIMDIQWSWLGQKRFDGSPMAAYAVSASSGCQTYAGEEELQLVRRGSVWKYYHNESLEFADILEEANFFKALGHTEEVRNSTTDVYAWTKEEALEALRSGTGHSIAVDSGMFGGEPITRVLRFRNEELGRRIAAKTLEGFA